MVQWCYSGAKPTPCSLPLCWDTDGDDPGVSSSVQSITYYVTLSVAVLCDCGLICPTDSLSRDFPFSLEKKKKQEFTVNTPKLRTPIPTLVIESNRCSHHTLLITHSLEAARLSLVLLQECGNLVALILSMLLPPSLTLSHTHALSLSQLLFPFSAYR